MNDSRHKKASESKSLMDSEKAVREALTKIWISQQRNETANISFEEEFGIDRHVSSEDQCDDDRYHQASLPELKEVEFYDDVIDLHSDTFPKKGKGPHRNVPRRLNRPVEGENLLSASPLISPTIDHLQESFTHFDIGSEVDDSKEREKPLKLPLLRALSRGSSCYSNESSPLPSPPPTARIKINDSSPRNISGLNEDLPNSVRSLPGSPKVRRLLVARSSDLTAQVGKHNGSTPAFSEVAHKVDVRYGSSQPCSPRAQKRRPGTPFTHNLDYDRISGKLSRSCSDLNLIKETAGLKKSKSNGQGLFPHIAR